MKKHLFRASVFVAVTVVAIGCGPQDDGSSTTTGAKPISASWLTKVVKAGFGNGTVKLNYTGTNGVKVIDGVFGTCVVTLHLDGNTLTYVPSNPALDPVKDATFGKLKDLNNSYALTDCLPQETANTRR